MLQISALAVEVSSGWLLSAVVVSFGRGVGGSGVILEFFMLLVWKNIPIYHVLF